MFIFAILRTFLILALFRTVDDGSNWGFAKTALITITTNMHEYPLHTEPDFYQYSMQSMRRRLLEYPRSNVQTYHSNDYNTIRKRYKPRNRFNEGRSYRFAKQDDEDEDEDEEEENNEDDKIDDEGEDTEQQENENDSKANGNNLEEDEETVADTAGFGGINRNRVPRSGYVPCNGKINEDQGQGFLWVRSADEKCQEETTEVPQYYEYETEVKNTVVSIGSNRCQDVLIVNILITNLLTLRLI